MSMCPFYQGILYRNSDLVLMYFSSRPSLLNFAHAMTAQLSWHVQNLAVITKLELGLEQICLFKIYGYQYVNVTRISKV